MLEVGWKPRHHTRFTGADRLALTSTNKLWDGEQVPLIRGYVKGPFSRGRGLGPVRPAAASLFGPKVFLAGRPYESTWKMLVYVCPVFRLLRPWTRHGAPRLLTLGMLLWSNYKVCVALLFSAAAGLTRSSFNFT